jgi:hypothetical protein
MVVDDQHAGHVTQGNRWKAAASLRASSEAPRSGPAYVEIMNYAVLWASAGEVLAGRLEAGPDGFTLSSGAGHRSVRFADVQTASIERSAEDRLRGLPALVLRDRFGAAVRVASLDRPGTLHELARRAVAGGITLAR